MMSANISELPATPAEWHEQIANAGLQGLSVFDLANYDSGSGITHNQYLLLRVLWLKKDQYEFSERVLDWIPGEELKEAKHLLSRLGTWHKYLKSFEQTAAELNQQILPDIGTFSLVRDSQCDVERIDRDNSTGSSKFSPIAHRTRNRTALQNSLQGPGTPTPAQRISYQTPEVLKKAFDKLDLDDTPFLSESSEAMESDILSPFSPEAAAFFPATKDEQIVNLALVLFLKAVTVHFIGRAHWSIERTAFHVADNGDKKFQARVDGVLLRHYDNRVVAILEVKPFVREKKEAAIQRQEAAQMAAWISSHSRKVDAVKPMMHEVYLTFATFDNEYVRYVTGDAGAEDDTFLRMNQFGPFVTSDSKHMKFLSYYILAITLKYCS